MDLKKRPDKTIRIQDNKCNRIQNESILPKYIHENLSNGSVIVPESGVKILSRGDLLGAINCLFPELNLKNSRIKLKENFSLFSYSPQELTRIFESRSKIITNKNSAANLSIHSFQVESDQSNLPYKTIGNSSKKAQSKQNTLQLNSMKQEEPVQFQSNYMDFLTNYLAIYFPDRLNDFKKIECLIQALNDLLKQISKTYKIAPFNPNLPVLNISQCDKVVYRKGNSSMEKLTNTSATSTTQHNRNKKALKANKIFKTQNEGRENDKKKSKKTCKKFNRNVIDNPSNKSVNDTTETRFNDFEDEIGRQIAQNLENILSDDTFSPRYKSKHASETLLICQKSLNENVINTKSIYTNSNLKFHLKNSYILKHQNFDGRIDEKIKLLEI